MNLRKELTFNYWSKGKMGPKIVNSIGIIPARGGLLL